MFLFFYFYSLMITIQILNSSHHPLPEYATLASSGMDVRAYLREPMCIAAHGRAMIPTGLCVQIPVGYEIQVRPRSGLAWKQGVTVLNAPGTIDADYRGEIKILLINHSTEDCVITDGDRIAQLVIQRVEQVEWELVQGLDATLRGEGGFGHSGMK